ncbi:YaaR family protein [Ammoniphilus sp. 3BR4]|uniref:YaaR family protein n=1 Tax=Ammoniphilus sp. 3BR4 TaxID=3158265 RepID=UPI003466E64C
MRIEDNRSPHAVNSKKSIDSLHQMIDDGIHFQDVVRQQHSKMTTDKLKKMISDIDAAGERLAKTRTVRELRVYKNLVKSFMEEAVKHGVGLEERQGFNRRGRSKVYKMVTEVNEKLVELTNAVLSKEQKGLDILNQVGEIKGLLVNMWL